MRISTVHAILSGVANALQKKSRRSVWLREPGKFKDTECGVPLYLHVYTPPAYTALHQRRGVLLRWDVCVGPVYSQRHQRNWGNHLSGSEWLQAWSLLCLPTRYREEENGNKIFRIFIHYILWIFYSLYIVIVINLILQLFGYLCILRQSWWCWRFLQEVCSLHKPPYKWPNKCFFPWEVLLSVFSCDIHLATHCVFIYFVSRAAVSSM